MIHHENPSAAALPGRSWYAFSKVSSESHQNEANKFLSCRKQSKK
tara:strand:- start:789 stop:923 length:135 start_codon:yes stop_codon:yes gene_type:complete